MVKEKALIITYAESSSKLLREMRLIDLASADVLATLKKHVLPLRSWRRPWGPNADCRNMNSMTPRISGSGMPQRMPHATRADPRQHGIEPNAAIISFKSDQVIKIRHILILFQTLHVSEMHQSIFRVLHRSAKLKAIVCARAFSFKPNPSIHSISKMLNFFRLKTRRWRWGWSINLLARIIVQMDLSANDLAWHLSRYTYIRIRIVKWFFDSRICFYKQTGDSVWTRCLYHNSYTFRNRINGNLITLGHLRSIIWFYPAQKHSVETKQK